jgi:hypothetical protein
LVIARSISEEFSSGDTRYRDNEDYPHTREKGKEKEDRDEGKRAFYREIQNVVLAQSLLVMAVAPQLSTKDGCQCYSSVIATFYFFFNRLHSVVTELLQIIVQTFSNLVDIGFLHMFNRGSIFPLTTLVSVCLAVIM